MVREEHCHEECWACRSDNESVNHDQCEQRCGNQADLLRCQAPCPCQCGRPLSRSEIFRLRSMLEALVVGNFS